MVGEISRSFFTIILGRSSSTLECYWFQYLLLENCNTFFNRNLPSIGCLYLQHVKARQFPGGSAVKNLTANSGDARDADSVPGSGRSPGGGNGNPLQYSCLENSMDRGAWQAIGHSHAQSLQSVGWQKSWTRLSD